MVEAKQIADESLAERVPPSLIFGPQYLAKTRELFGKDPFPYGLEANRDFIQTTIDYSFQQGLTPKKEKPEDLFEQSTLSF